MVLMKGRSRAWASGREIIGKAGPSFIKTDNAEMRGMEETGREGGAQTADTKPPPCISERPTVRKCDQHNGKQIHFVSICIGL